LTLSIEEIQSGGGSTIKCAANDKRKASIYDRFGGLAKLEGCRY
jgi:hypothetical protein